jgi:hypothetical protein
MAPIQVLPGAFAGQGIYYLDHQYPLYPRYRLCFSEKRNQKPERHGRLKIASWEVPTGGLLKNSRPYASYNFP